MSPNPAAALSPPAPERPLASIGAADAAWGGLSRSASIKIGIVAGLLALLFRFNLSRLWLKTNPFTGQENWGHSLFVPLIGLYFLYVHREELIRPPPVRRTDNSMLLAWGLFQLVAGTAFLLLLVCVPRLLDLLGRAADATGLLSHYHGWPITPLYLWMLYAIATAIGAVVLSRRPVAKVLSDWASRVWPGLAVWLMFAAVIWGLGFFVFAVAQNWFNETRIILSIVSLAFLAGVLALVGSLRELVDRLLAASHWWFGGYVLVFGVLFSLWGIYPGQNDFFKDVGMVIALFGVVLLLTDWRVMRVAWFPILFLFCALPWPDQVYSWVALPLQHLAAAVAVRFLTMCGITSHIAGTRIMMQVIPGQPPRILNVEEACAGLKSLMTFVTLAGGWAFVVMSSRPLWHRLIQTASAVPIAIFCNVMRVSFTGLTDRFWGPEFSEGATHKYMGLLLLVPAFFLILLVGWVLDHLFIEEADDETGKSAAQSVRARQKAAATAGKKLIIPNRAAVAAAAAQITASTAARPQPALNPSVSGVRPMTGNANQPAKPAGPRNIAENPKSTPVRKKEGT